MRVCVCCFVSPIVLVPLPLYTFPPQLKKQIYRTLTGMDASTVSQGDHDNTTVSLDMESFSAVSDGSTVRQHRERHDRDSKRRWAPRHRSPGPALQRRSSAPYGGRSRSKTRGRHHRHAPEYTDGTIGSASEAPPDLSKIMTEQSKQDSKIETLQAKLDNTLTLQVEMLKQLQSIGSGAVSGREEVAAPPPPPLPMLSNVNMGVPEYDFLQSQSQSSRPVPMAYPPQRVMMRAARRKHLVAAPQYPSPSSGLPVVYYS